MSNTYFDEDDISSYKANRNTAQQAQPQQQRQAPPTGNAQKTFNFRDLRGAVLAHIGTSKDGKTALTTMQQITEQFVAQNVERPVSKFLLIEDPQLSVTALVAYFTPASTICYYMVYLLAASAQPPSNKMIQIHNGTKTIEKDFPVSDYFNEKMRAVVEHTLKTTLQHSGVSFMGISNYGITVIPKEVNLEDISALAPFYIHMVSSLSAAISIGGGISTSSLTCDRLRIENRKLVAQFVLTPGATYRSSIGQPMAGDFTVTTSSVPVNTRQYSDMIHSKQDESVITHLVGYLDFIRIPQQRHLPQYGVPQNYYEPGYNPVIVITELSSFGKTAVPIDSLLTFLLALPSVIPLVTAEQKWTQLFAPNIGTTNKATLGALSLEHNLEPGKPFQPKITELYPDTGVYNPEITTISEFARAFVSTTPVIVLDILNGGPLMGIYYYIVFAKPGTECERIILRELDSFFAITQADGSVVNDVFTRLWQAAGSPCIIAQNRNTKVPDEPTIIHAATVITGDKSFGDASESILDIRSCDYLSVLERSNGNKEVIDAYSCGYVPGTYSDEELDMKRNILKNMFANLNITGKITRVHLNNAFISVIEEALKVANIIYQVEGLQDSMAFSNERHYFDPDSVNVPLKTHGAFNAWANNPNTPPTGFNNPFMNSMYR